MKTLFLSLTLIVLTTIFPLNTAYARYSKNKKQCLINNKTINRELRGDAYCINIIKQKILMVYDGFDYMLPGGRSKNIGSSQIKEPARLTACKNTLDSIFGLQYVKEFKLTIGDLIYSHNKKHYFKCKFNKTAQNFILNEVPYKVIDGNLKRNKVFQVYFDDPRTNQKTLWQHPALRKKILNMLQR